MRVALFDLFKHVAWHSFKLTVVLGVLVLPLSPPRSVHQGGAGCELVLYWVFEVLLALMNKLLGNLLVIFGNQISRGGNGDSAY